MKLTVLSSSLVIAATAAAECQPQWLTGIGDPRLNGAITSLLVHDFGDGNGLSVYAAGLFTDSEDGPLHRIARWDGMRWHPLGAGMNNSVSAIAVLQTQEQEVPVAGGTFTELIAGGQFTVAGDAPAARVAKWDGAIIRFWPMSIRNRAIHRCSSGVHSRRLVDSCFRRSRDGMVRHGRHRPIH